MESCKGCGGRKTDTYKGKVYCHFCGQELGDDPMSGLVRVYGSTGSGYWTAENSFSTAGVYYADRT